MGDEITLNPDINFIKELKEAGGETLKKCYQCATCSVVCPISPEDNPFPRKQMVMAQFGMKDEILADPAVWYCHNCNDCSKYCPRGARPGDVLSAVRQWFIKEFSVPKFMGSIATNPKMIGIALAIPIILFIVILGITGHFHIPDGKIVYSKFFPISYIEGIFFPLVIIAGVLYIISLRKYWKVLNKVNGTNYVKSFGDAFVESITELVKHEKFAKCETNADRKNGHLLVLYGFIGLFITTLWITFYYYVLKKHSPISLLDPMKWFANLSALFLLVGIVIIILNKLKDKGVNTKTSYFDWLFIIIILSLAITGVFTELIRLAGIKELAYPMYFLHLVLVFYIIVYFPYSKLAHMGYRILAITHYKMTGKDKD